MSQATNVIDFNSARKPEGPLIADIDNGYCKVANDLLDAICQQDLSGSQFQVLMAIVRCTYGYNKKADRITNTYLAELTGISLSAVKSALIKLVERNILQVEKTGMMKLVCINTTLSEWQNNGAKKAAYTRKKGTIAATEESHNCGQKEPQLQPSKKPQLRPEVATIAATKSHNCGHTKYNYKNNLQKTNNNVVSQVFLYWQKTMQKPQAKLTSDRRNKITARLNDGYTAEQLMAAIDGCANSDFHMGRQPGKPTQYNDIELICRTGSKVEQFAAIKAQPVQDDDWVARMMADTEVLV